MIKIPNLKTLDHRKRIGLVIQSGILGWIVLLSQIDVIMIEPSWHERLVLFTALQLILLSGTIFTINHKNTNARIRCQICNMAMSATSYKCRICNSKFMTGKEN